MVLACTTQYGAYRRLPLSSCEVWLDGRAVNCCPPGRAIDHRLGTIRRRGHRAVVQLLLPFQSFGWRTNIVDRMSVTAEFAWRKGKGARRFCLGVFRAQPAARYLDQ